MEYLTTDNQIKHIDLAKWKIDTTCQLSILRIDLNHINFAHKNSHLLNGNKLYKLKYNIYMQQPQQVIFLDLKLLE